MSLMIGWGRSPLQAQTLMDTAVTLSTTAPTVRQLLQQLESTKLFQIAYSESYLDVKQTIRLRNQTPTVKEVLDAISRVTNTTYRVRGGQIIFSAKAVKVTISGYVRDTASGENLIGVNIRHKQTHQGTSSNAYGFYSITLPSVYTSPNDSVTLVYSYVGYTPRSVSLKLSQDTTLTVRLVDAALLDEVVVTAQREERREVTQMSTVSVPIEQIKSVPALLGEVDVLKTLQLLPGRAIG